jgi:tRNA A37 threonylcarbamoyladenosine dehydratase
VDAGAQHPAGLNCAGYGSVMTVTAAFGMLLTARALDVLVDKRR